MDAKIDSSHLFVVLHLQNPKEKYWGILQRNTAAGVWLTGVDLKTVEERLSFYAGDSKHGFMLSSTFFPMHRVEKITVDENCGEIPSVIETLLSRGMINLENIIPESFFHPKDVF